MNNRTLAKWSLRNAYINPLFISVLVLKLLAGTFLASAFLRDLFTPFVNYYVSSGFADPWQFFYQHGEKQAFPYHPLMLWIFSLPRFFLSPFLSSDWSVVTPLHLFSMRFPLFVADITIFTILVLWFKNETNKIIKLYWCSPVVFYICYFHGQLDAIPTALFLASLFLIKREEFVPAMIVLGFGLATKAHLLVALPFVFVYLAERLSISRVFSLLGISVFIYLTCAAPYIWSEGFRAMVLQNEQQKLVFAYRIPIPGANVFLYLCPAILCLVFLRFNAYPKRNWDLTLLYLGIAFCSFVMLVPPMQGWFMWTFPFITYFFCREPRLNVSALLFFSASYLFYFLSLNSSDLFDAFALLSSSISTLNTPSVFLEQWGFKSELWQGLGFTAMQSSLFLLVAMMYRIGVRSNEIYRARTRPALIGIAGDSGAGKDTLVRLCRDLLGESNLIALSGDDYHKWERNNENWNVFSHLDVRTNRLHQLLDHTIALKDGNSVVKVKYSHETGRFTQPEELDPNKYVAIVGLHSLVLEKMRDIFDLKVFVDPDENLRRFWKIRRDVTERGHTKESVLQTLSTREKDRLAHILPQREKADLVFSLKSLTPLSFENLEAEPELSLQVLASNSFNLEDTQRALTQHPTIACTLTHDSASSKQYLNVKGFLASNEIESLVAFLIPNAGELLSERASFTAGLQGVMQLIFLVCLSSALRWKKSSDMVQITDTNERDTWVTRQSA